MSNLNDSQRLELAKQAFQAGLDILAGNRTTFELVDVESTNVRSVAYNYADKKLRVFFISGGIYDYLNVPESVYLEMIESHSVGKYLNARVKNAYKFNKVN